MVSKIKILHQLEAAAGISTLAARTPIAVASLYATMSPSGFLMKKLRGSARMVFVEPGDNGLLVLAYSDATLAEVETALEAINTDLVSDEVIDQAIARRIIGIAKPHNGGLGTGGSGKNEIIYDLSDIEIPSGGLPFGESNGWVWYFYNDGGGAFTTGASMIVSARFHGVSL